MLSSASASFHRLTSSSPSIPTPFLPSSASLLPKSTTTRYKNRVYFSTFAIRKPIQLDILQEEETEMAEEESVSESVLYSISPLPLLVIGALPGGNRLTLLLISYTILFSHFTFMDFSCIFITIDSNSIINVGNKGCLGLVRASTIIDDTFIPILEFISFL